MIRFRTPAPAKVHEEREGYRVGRRLPVSELKMLAAGRWFDILIAAGITAEKLDGRNQPCPKCGGRDRFAAFANINAVGAVHCRKCFTVGCDPSPGDGIATLQWFLGLDFLGTLDWLADHLGVGGRAGGGGVIRRKPKRIVAPEAEADPRAPSGTAGQTPDFDQLAGRFFDAMSDEQRLTLATKLNLAPELLIRMRVGFSVLHQASTWPMVDSNGRVVGLRLRGGDNAKWSFRGGRAGLFVPDGLPTTIKRLHVCEGPTDTAAVLSLGLDAIGRASCNGNVATVANFVRRVECDDVVIVADHDPAGIAGALRLARVLTTVAQCVRIIKPGQPGDDVRKAVAEGLDAYELDELVLQANIMTLGIHRRLRRRNDR